MLIRGISGDARQVLANGFGNRRGELVIAVAARSNEVDVRPLSESLKMIEIADLIDHITRI